MTETSAVLRFTFSRGTGILTVSPQDQIAEPFRAAIEDNQLIGTWCYLVVGVGGIARVLGAFVSTVGGRLLFSPADPIAVSVSEKFSVELNPLNHITLERKRGSYASHLKGGPPPHDFLGHPIGAYCPALNGGVHGELVPRPTISLDTQLGHTALH